MTAPAWLHNGFTQRRSTCTTDTRVCTASTHHHMTHTNLTVHNTPHKTLHLTPSPAHPHTTSTHTSLHTHKPLQTSFLTLLTFTPLHPPTSSCTPHTSHCTPHTLHCTPHTSSCTPHTSRCTPHTLHCTPHTSCPAHPTPSRCTSHTSALHTSHLMLHTPHLALHTSHLVLHTPHLALHTSHLMLHTPHLMLHTSHLVLHTSHLVLHTPHLALHTSHLMLHGSLPLLVVLEVHSCGDNLWQAVNSLVHLPGEEAVGLQTHRQTDRQDIVRWVLSGRADQHSGRAWLHDAQTH